MRCAPPKTLYNRWKRWGRTGERDAFEWACEVGCVHPDHDRPGPEAADEKTIMIDATHMKAHRTASSLRVKKEGRGRQIGRTKGGMKTKLHAVADAQGRAIRMFVTAGPDITSELLLC